jgi:hypothetical protein
VSAVSERITYLMGFEVARRPTLPLKLATSRAHESTPSVLSRGLLDLNHPNPPRLDDFHILDACLRAGDFLARATAVTSRSLPSKEKLGCVSTTTSASASPLEACRLPLCPRQQCLLLPRRLSLLLPARTLPPTLITMTTTTNPRTRTTSARGSASALVADLIVDLRSPWTRSRTPSAALLPRRKSTSSRGSTDERTHARLAICLSGERRRNFLKSRRCRASHGLTAFIWEEI